jgi:phage/plasmid-like protein (TIGR03299 family)
LTNQASEEGERMPDAVETYAGVGAEPWWLGSSLTAKSAEVLPGESVDIDTLRVAAGLDWTVSKQPAFVTGNHARRIAGWNAVQRDTDGAIYGLVKDTYHLFQNEEAFAFVKALLAETDPEGLTAGALYGGAIGWVQVKLPGDIYVKGDGSPLADYLLGTWGHTGRHGLTWADVLIRVVCANTQSAALKGAKHKYTVRHTPGMAGKVEEVRKALDIHAKYREVLGATLNDLAERRMSLAELMAFTEVLLPKNPDVDKAYRTEAERAGIVALWQNSETITGLPETAYRAYQAVTQYLDHEKVYRATKTATAADRRVEAITDGSAYTLKSKALALLVTA